MAGVDSIRTAGRFQEQNEAFLAAERAIANVELVRHLLESQRLQEFLTEEGGPMFKQKLPGNVKWAGEIEPHSIIVALYSIFDDLQELKSFVGKS